MPSEERTSVLMMCASLVSNFNLSLTLLLSGEGTRRADEVGEGI